MTDKVIVNNTWKIVKPEEAYFLGFLWADGCVYERPDKGQYLVRISIVSDDFQYISPILKNISEWHQSRYKPKNPNWREKTQASLYSKLFTKFLMSHGFDNKENPHTILKSIPEYLHHYFWRGLFDGDGHIHIGHRSFACGVSSSYNQDWSALALLCQELHAGYFLQRRQQKNGRSSDLRFSNQTDALKFLDFIYQTFNKDNIGFKRKFLTYQQLKQKVTARLATRTSAVQGVCFVHARNKWMVQKQIDKIKIKKYGFLTEQEAINYLNKITHEHPSVCSNLNAGSPQCQRKSKIHKG